MSVFFNGRLIVSPTSASNVDDSQMANKNLSVGNVLALIGPSTGGAPNTPLRFGNAQDAKAALISGDLLDAVVRAFDPSSQVTGPQTIVAIRVNPAVQAALTLQDSSSANVINLVSTDYGQYTNQIKVKIETGSTAGKKATVQLGNNYFSADNLTRNALSVQYTGANASANITINNSTVTLASPTGTTVATIDLNTYKTVQQLVDRINAVSGFTASVMDGNGNTPALNGLDSVTAIDVKTSAYTVLAVLQAVVDWFNSAGEGYVTATRVAGAGTLPTNIGFTYLTGGSDGVTTNTNWSNAYTTLQQVDAQWVVPVTGDASIHAMNDTHCSYMSNIGKMERRGIVGMALASTDAAAIAEAKSLNSDRTSLVHIGMYDYDANGNWTLYAPYIVAAMIAGAFAGVNPGTPMTNKSLKVRGLERQLRNPTDTDPLIQAGVMCVENTKTGYKVVKSITTWLLNTNYNRVEVSTGVAVDFAVRNVREALDVLRGEKGTPILLARAVSITESVLRTLSQPEPQGVGVLVGDKTNPPYKNIQATLVGDVVQVSYLCQPVVGVNYVLSTCFAKPYSGSASA
jgi:hypothetical protein